MSGLKGVQDVEMVFLPQKVKARGKEKKQCSNWVRDPLNSVERKEGRNEIYVIADTWHSADNFALDVRPYENQFFQASGLSTDTFEVRLECLEGATFRHLK